MDLPVDRRWVPCRPWRELSSGSSRRHFTDPRGSPGHERRPACCDVAASVQQPAALRSRRTEVASGPIEQPCRLCASGTRWSATCCRYHACLRLRIASAPDPHSRGGTGCADKRTHLRPRGLTRRRSVTPVSSSPSADWPAWLRHRPSSPRWPWQPCPSRRWRRPVRRPGSSATASTSRPRRSAGRSPASSTRPAATSVSTTRPASPTLTSTARATSASSSTACTVNMTNSKVHQIGETRSTAPSTAVPSSTSTARAARSAATRSTTSRRTGSRSSA